MFVMEANLKQIKKNVFPRSLTSESNIKLRKDAYKINSSQALAIDFWGCIKLSPYKDRLINEIFNKKADGWDIKFEFKSKTNLNEKTPSQIDILIEIPDYAIIIESKFTEKSGGGCSLAKKNNNGILQCNGNYSSQTNPLNNIVSSCPLSGKGIKYWDYISKLTKYDKDVDYSPCPFIKGEYQWMRNICFAEAYAEIANKHTESFLAYFQSPKCKISNDVDNNIYLGKLSDQLINPKAFSPISYNSLLDICLKCVEDDINEKLIWLELKKWMYNKERMIK